MRLFLQNLHEAGLRHRVHRIPGKLGLGKRRSKHIVYSVHRRPPIVRKSKHNHGKLLRKRVQHRVELGAYISAEHRTLLVDILSYPITRCTLQRLIHFAVCGIARVKSGVCVHHQNITLPVILLSPVAKAVHIRVQTGSSVHDSDIICSCHVICYHYCIWHEISPHISNRFTSITGALWSYGSLTVLISQGANESVSSLFKNGILSNA